MEQKLSIEIGLYWYNRWRVPVAKTRALLLIWSPTFVSKSANFVESKHARQQQDCSIPSGGFVSLDKALNLNVDYNFVYRTVFLDQFFVTYLNFSKRCFSTPYRSLVIKLREIFWCICGRYCRNCQLWILKYLLYFSVSIDTKLLYITLHVSKHSMAAYPVECVNSSLSSSRFPAIYSKSDFEVYWVSYVVLQ